MTEEDKDKTHSVQLGDKQYITCLAYADDILILSKSAIGIQRSLDILDRFCNTWNMKVNIEKTKCITFQKKNKVNKNDIFHMGGYFVSNICEFTYLGRKINAAGSFISSIEYLSQKGRRACFALNRKNQAKTYSSKHSFDAFRCICNSNIIIWSRGVEYPLKT